MQSVLECEYSTAAAILEDEILPPYWLQGGGRNQKAPFSECLQVPKRTLIFLSSKEPEHAFYMQILLAEISLMSTQTGVK